MITNYEKFRLIDENKQKEFFIEVNWDKKDEHINNCKILKITFPNGEEMLLKKEYLNSLLFLIGTADEQQKMIPQVIRRSKWYETVISVKAKKDIKKGENITFPLKITLPSVEQEAIAGIKKEQRESKILIPTKQ